MPRDLKLLLELAQGPLLVLCETKFHALSLRAELPVEIRAETVAEGVWRIFLRANPAAKRLGPEDVQCRLLRELSPAGAFPLLASELSELSALSAGGRGRSAARSSYIGSLVRFLDRVRLESGHEAILKGMLDEFGNTRADRARLEQLFLLLENHRNLQEQENAFDSVGALEWLVGRLRSADRKVQAAVTDSVPPIVLNQPTELFPLEAELWDLIAKFHPLRFLVAAELLEQHEGELPPSKRAAGSVIRFLTGRDDVVTLPRADSGRARLAAHLFDGVSLPEEEPISAPFAVRETEEIRDEVRNVARTLAAAVSTGAVQANRVHIVALSLDPYEELLTRELASVGLRAWVPRGRALSETTPGSLLSAALDWLFEPHEASFFAFREHPLFRHPPLDAGFTILAQRFSEELEGVFGPVSPVELAMRAKSAPFAGTQAGELRRLIEVLGLPKQIARAEQWTGPIMRSLRKPKSGTERLLGLVSELAFLEQELEFRSECENAEPEILPGLLIRHLRACRSTRHRTQAPIGESERSLFGRALRKLSPVLRRALRLALTERETASVFSVFHSAAAQLLAAEFCVPSRPAGAIPVTELLDVRGTQGGVRVVLGASSEYFPPVSPLDIGDETERFGNWLEKRSGRTSAVYESYALMSHILTSSDEVLFTYARQGSGDQFAPAEFVTELHRRIAAAPTTLVAESAAPREVPPIPDTASLRARLIAERAAGVFGEFDGMIAGSTTLPERLSALSGAEPGVSRYSVSELETFADCPHRFFFGSMLGLRTEPDSLLGKLSVETGIVVHRALEEFYKTPGNPALPKENFDAACRRMRAIAAEAFDRSSYPWDSHPAFRDAKERIVRGLDEPGDSGKRGMLKAALAYQRDLFEEEPLESEYRFGMGAHQALQLTAGEQQIEIRGAIDRIDGKRVANGTVELSAVWDYKSGAAEAVGKVDRGKSLQIPLYALAARRAFGSDVRRGGIISLAKPNLRGEDLTSSKSGVIVEHLAVATKAIGDEPLQTRIENAAQQVFALDLLLREGRLHQIPDTEGCEHCEFRTVCRRDEVLLEVKTKGSDPVPPPACPSVARETTVEAHFSRGPLRTPTVEQQSALALDAPLVLRASAGSGKTFVLVNRVLTLLLTGVPVQSIVAITFTEKAAAEIRERVRTAIGSVLEANEYNGQAISDEQAAHLSRARCELTEAHFGTIHSFAGSIVRTDPLLSGLGRYQGVLEGTVRWGLLEELSSEVLARGGRSDTAELLSSGVSYSNLKKQLCSFASNAQVLDALCDAMADEQSRGDLLRHVETALAEYRRTSLDALSAYVGDWAAETESALPILQPKLKPGAEEGFRELIRRSRMLSEALSREEQTWPEAFAAALTYAVEHNKFSVNKDAKTGRPNHWNELRDTLKDFDSKLPNLVSDAEPERRALELAGAFCRLARGVQERFGREKRRRALADFDDLIVSARRMLCGRFGGELHERQAALKARLRAAYTHFLVDEFQDTDPAQWEFVRELAQPFESPHRSLFIVGDRQQAIYGFRGGDVRVFTRAEKELVQIGGRTLRLEDNYRSHPGVVRFVNELFAQVFALETEGGEHCVSHEPMRPARAGDGSEVRVTKLAFAPSAKTPSGKDAEEAEHVAGFIEEVLADSSNGGARFAALPKTPAGPSIAVLTRNAKQLLLLARSLSSRRIPFSLSHSSGFYGLDEVAQCEHLIQTLVEPGNSIALVGVLRSAFFGLGDGELLKLYLALGRDWLRLREGPVPPEWEHVSSQLSRVAAAASLLKGSQLLEFAAVDAGLETAYRLAGAPEAFRNLERAVDALRAAEKAAGDGSLVFALRWFDQQRREGTAAPNANDASNPVVLSTVHGAKGLEFPMVILPFLKPRSGRSSDFIRGELTPAGANPIAVLGIRVEDEERDYKRQSTFIQRLLEQENMKRRCAEERRLFYVACTRAREYLVLGVPERTEYEKKKGEDAESESGVAEAPIHWVRAFAPDLPLAPR